MISSSYEILELDCRNLKIDERRQIHAEKDGLLYCKEITQGQKENFPRTKNLKFFWFIMLRQLEFKSTMLFYEIFLLRFAITGLLQKFVLTM